MLRVTVLLVASLAFSTPALAEDKAQDTETVDPGKKSCRATVKTGSSLRRSVCRTAAQWKQIDADNAEAARYAADQLRSTPMRAPQ